MNPVATFQTMMLAWDTDDLFGLPPFKADFVDYVKCDTPVKDVTKSNKVIGISINIHRFKNSTGYDVYLLGVLYHLLTSEIHLLSPQNYHQMHGRNMSVYSERVGMNLRGH